MTSEMLDIALSYMEGLDCGRSLAIAILLREGDWGQIFEMKTDPALYSCSADYLSASAATDFFSKLDDDELQVVGLEDRAIAKWWWAERECFRTNRRLNEIFDFGTLAGSPVRSDLLEFFSRLRKNLLWLIGSGPPELPGGRFGPGATVSDNSRRTTVLDKLSTVPTITSGATGFLLPWTRTKWAQASLRRQDEISVVRGNSFFTVPKKATSRRSCAKEPSLNVFYQLGLGSTMRKRLKGRGIDLDHGQDVHRLVACTASRDAEFCTIDLSSASDTLCVALVNHTLPRKWLNDLTALRSPITSVKGKAVRLEKFSSMGNGFTFELETAVFTAICMSVIPDGQPGVNIFVYGDDIIVPTSTASDVLGALRFCGFTPNEEKTFVSGAFRESCGGDFFNGDPVRGHYVKEFPDAPHKYISLANGIRRVQCLFRHLDIAKFRGLRKAWFRTLDSIPVQIRSCRGPRELGDIVVHDDEERWLSRWRSSIRYIRCYRPARFKGVRFGRFHPDVQFAAALYGVALRSIPGKPPSERMCVVRDGVMGYKIGWVPRS